MKAFIPAAGFGRRMSELTAEIPKPLLPVNDLPLICYTLFQLYRWKVESVIINVHYRGEKIIDFLKDFSCFPLHFSEEKKILGTAGGIRAAFNFIGREKQLIILNPDQIILPHSDDSPERYIDSIKDNISGCLFLKHRNDASGETGWSFRNYNKILKNEMKHNKSLSQIDNDPEGDFYYMGYSIINPATLANIASDDFSELGSHWKKQAGLGTLFGSVFRGKIVEVGDKTSYLGIKNDSSIVPEKLQSAWKLFLRESSFNYEALRFK